MKKILLISDNKIFGHGGGCLEEHKYYDGLKNYSKQNGIDFKVLSIDEKFEDSFFVKMEKSKKADILSRVFGHSSYVYIEWLKLKKDIIKYNPDMIVLGRTRLGFIAKSIKKNNIFCKIVSNIENIEYDYVDGYFSNREGIIGKLYIALEKCCVRRDELMAIKYSDALDYLTEKDYRRCHALYGVECKNETILPICIENETHLSVKSKEKSVVFIGSLNYASNIDALTKFVSSVWLPNYNNRNDIKLVVGGANPKMSLKKLLNSLNNCVLFENFKTLEDIVPVNSMVIAPIQKGAGMKVKVAETLSMGLMIAASDEALVGYEEALKEDYIGGIQRVNSVDEYKYAIDSFIATSKSDLIAISEQNINLFKKYYSYERSREVISKICTEELSEQNSWIKVSL